MTYPLGTEDSHGRPAAHCQATRSTRISAEAIANVPVTARPIPRITAWAGWWSHRRTVLSPGSGTMNAAALTNPKGTRISHRPFNQLPEVYLPQW